MNARVFDELTRSYAAASRRRALKLAATAPAEAPPSEPPAEATPTEAPPVAVEPTAAPAATAPADPGTCTGWVLAGGPTPEEPIQVDDDLTVLLNGAVIFEDADGLPNVRPPLPFQAAAGDHLTVVARDATACGRKIGALWLHDACGAGEARFLTGGLDEGCVEDRRVPENFYRASWVM